MKLFKSIFTLLGISCLINFSCKRDFLQRNPQTDISEEVFFATPADLETYTNGLYSQLQVSFNDINSDNISTQTDEKDVAIRGTLNQGNLDSDNTGWNNWWQLRRINFMLDNVEKVQGNAVDINHYIGIARFFRALFYFNKIKRFSNVPWYSSVLATNDEGLSKAQDPRAFVADKILEDLQYAADNIKPGSTDTRITKWAALTLLARFGLYEGTFRKYHSELNLTTDYLRFLTVASDASTKIMTGTGGFEIPSGGGGAAYKALFSSNALSSNKEIILWMDYDQALSVGNNTHTVVNFDQALSKSLADTYLKTDGTPFTDYTKPFATLFSNRDPRMKETMNYPGWIPSISGVPYRINPTMGGYAQIKFFPGSSSLIQGWYMNYTDLPIFRYAEVLLINAEAKAELGTITQSDLDNTINKIRKRVSMPDLTMAVALDPVLAASYPNVTVANKNVLLEIRRERRVEMACEGLRYDDIMRWKCGKLLEAKPQGIYVAALGAMDVTGDGVEDIAILPSPSDSSSIASLPASVKNSLTRYFLKDASGAENTFYLSNGTSGYVSFVVDRNQLRTFIEPKYYYRPIPVEQINLNPNLKQVFDWDK